MRRRTAGIAAVLSGILLLAGCWDNNEINNVNFILGMAVDKGEQDKYKISFQWSIPSASSAPNEPLTSFETFTIEENSITEARSVLTQLSPRRPIYAHMEVFVIGEEVAKEGIEDIVDQLGREFQMRRTLKIVVAQGKGEDILRSETPFENSPTVGIREVVGYTNRASSYEEMELHEFFESYAVPGLLSRMPIVYRISQQADERVGPEEKAYVEVEGMGIFQEDHLVHQLNGQETRAWMFTMGKVENGTSVRYKQGQKWAVCRSMKQSRKVSINPRSTPVHVDYSIRMACNVTETSGDWNSMNPAHIREIQQGLEEMIRGEIEQMIAKVQREKLDILYIGKRMNERHLREWRRLKDNWEEEFARAEIRVHTNVEVNHSGTIIRQMHHD